jgi:hypothetical protein
LPYLSYRHMPLQMDEVQMAAALREDLGFLVIAAVAAGVFEEICKPLGLLVHRPLSLEERPSLAVGTIQLTDTRMTRVLAESSFVDFSVSGDSEAHDRIAVPGEVEREVPELRCLHTSLAHFHEVPLPFA